MMFDYDGCIGYYDVPTTNLLDEAIEKIFVKVREWGYSGSLEQFKELDKKVFEEYDKTEKKTHITVSEMEIYTKLTINLFKVKIAPSKVYELQRTFWGHVFSHGKLYQDTLTVLKVLKEKMIKLAIVSNRRGTEFFLEFLKQKAVAPFFDQIVTSEMVGYAKPHQEIFHKALRLLEISSPEAVFIGNDLEVDIEGARGVGMKTILIDRDGKAKLPSKKLIKISIMNQIFEALEGL
jgi:HAD superfamily hydrolase (TIGR01509 family)